MVAVASIGVPSMWLNWLNYRATLRGNRKLDEGNAKVDILTKQTNGLTDHIAALSKAAGRAEGIEAERARAPDAVPAPAVIVVPVPHPRAVRATDLPPTVAPAEPPQETH